jgi:hypothetical protein
VAVGGGPLALVIGGESGEAARDADLDDEDPGLYVGHGGPNLRTWSDPGAGGATGVEPC